MDSPLPMEHGLLYLFLSLLVNMMTSCLGRSQRQSKVCDQLNPLNTWSQIIESKEPTKPTANEYSTVPTVRYPYFFPHSKLFNETDGYLHNDTIYIEISFSDPPIPPTQSSLSFPFP